MSVVVWAVQWLKNCVAEGKKSANRVEVQAHETSDKMSELQLLVEWLTRTIACERAQVADLVDVGLLRIRSVTTEALFESKESVSEAISVV